MKHIFSLLFIFMAFFAVNLRAGTVYYIPQFSEFKEVNQNDMFFMKRVLKDAEKENAKAVILELDTPGGRIDVALKYVSIFSKSSIPVIVYLNPNGISAGMVIALAADKIAMNPMGVIGDAMPMQQGFDGARPITKDNPNKNETDKSGEAQKSNEKPETIQKLINSLDNTSDEDKSLANQKFLTVYFKILEVLAEKNNRPVEVILATSDPYQKLTKEVHGIDHQEVSPLTLSAKEAKELNVVDYIVEDREDLLIQLGYEDDELKIVEKSAMDQISSFLAHSAVAGILIALGLVGIFIEIRTPGFGVPGGMGILCLVLFFLGQVQSGATEWGMMVVFFIGLLLLILEIFVIPGFGIVGVLGFGCIGVSLVGAFGWDNLDMALKTVSLSFLGTIIILILLITYVFPKSTIFNRLSLSATSGAKDENELKKLQVENELIDKIGVTQTPLLPSGKILIENHIYEAVANIAFIDKECQVRVIGKNSFELIVEKVEG